MCIRDSLNTIMAEELDEFYAQLKDAPDFTAALHKLIRDTFSAHRRIIFNLSLIHIFISDRRSVVSAGGEGQDHRRGEQQR